jgi:hypothetical protein
MVLEQKRAQLVTLGGKVDHKEYVQSCYLNGCGAEMSFIGFNARKVSQLPRNYFIDYNESLAGNFVRLRLYSTPLRN